MKLIGNGRVITRDKQHPYYENGAVVIDGSKILEVGNYDEMKKKYNLAESMDVHGKVIMPGLINSHQHSYSVFARGLSIPGNHPMDFLQILEGTWWRIDRKLLLNHTYYSAMAVYLEGIQNGVTTVIDHHASYGKVTGSLFAIEEAAKNLGIRACLAYEISDRDGLEKMREAIRENMNFIHVLEHSGNELVRGLVGLHASFTLSDATLNAVKESNDTGTGYHIHVAEGKLDADLCQKNYRKSIVKRLYDWGILGNHTICAHCIHIDEKDMDLLKQTDTCVVHNPESNMGNAVGAPDIITMLEKGILVGLGTDGYTCDMLESLKVANLLQKHRRGLPDRGADEACQMLFENNQEIATRQFNQSIGYLKTGSQADLIVVDYVPYTPMTANNLDGHIMFGMSGGMTDTTIVNGRILMENHQMVNLDVEEIKAKCMESAKDLWSTI